MNNSKEVWTVEPAGKFSAHVFHKDNRILTSHKEDCEEFAARLNATEGLNIEALQKHPEAIWELIEAAKAAKIALEVARMRLQMENPAIQMLESALTKLGE